MLSQQQWQLLAFFSRWCVFYAELLRLYTYCLFSSIKQYLSPLGSNSGEFSPVNWITTGLLLDDQIFWNNSKDKTNKSSKFGPKSSVCLCVLRKNDSFILPSFNQLQRNYQLKFKFEFVVQHIFIPSILFFGRLIFRTRQEKREKKKPNCNPLRVIWRWRCP